MPINSSQFLILMCQSGYFQWYSMFWASVNQGPCLYVAYSLYIHVILSKEEEVIDALEITSWNEKYEYSGSVFILFSWSFLEINDVGTQLVTS